MPTPGEYKTVQARILAYARAIGWIYVPRSEAENRRGFDHSKATPAEQAAEASPYFDELLDAQVRKLNPKYAEGSGALVGDLRRLHSDIAGNRDFLAYLRNTKTFYDKGEGRELHDEFPQSLEMAHRAMSLATSPDVQAICLEWIAISQAALGHPPETVRAAFHAARELAPENQRIAKNLKLFEDSVSGLPSPDVRWERVATETVRSLG